MLRNVYINCEKNISINKVSVHKLISFLKKEFDLSIKCLEINFVLPDTIFEINKRYLKHNYLTDVIAFNYSTESYNLDAEIFICNQVAKENAKIYNVSYNEELRRLVIHGILHLIGYNDKNAGQKNKMKLMEDLIVKRTKKIDILGL